MRILHIHPRKIYFEQVRNKEKTEEYREIKPYWNNLLKKDYDLIYYYAAYTSEKLIFEYKGHIKKIVTHKEFGDKPLLVYAIDLTKRVNALKGKTLPRNTHKHT